MEYSTPIEAKRLESTHLCCPHCCKELPNNYVLAKGSAKQPPPAPIQKKIADAFNENRCNTPTRVFSPIEPLPLAKEEAPQLPFMSRPGSTLAYSSNPMTDRILAQLDRNHAASEVYSSLYETISKAPIKVLEELSARLDALECK